MRFPGSIRIGPAVKRERWLAVGGRFQKMEPPASAKFLSPGKERCNIIPPLKPLWPGRHHHNGILTQQRRKPIDIGAFPGFYITIENFALRLRRLLWLSLASCGKPLPECGSCALKSAV